MLPIVPVSWWKEGPAYVLTVTTRADARILLSPFHREYIHACQVYIHERGSPRWSLIRLCNLFVYACSCNLDLLPRADFRVICLVFILHTELLEIITIMTISSIPKAADFVIIGGGTAGLVLAARLSEAPDTEVLVLECGKDIAEEPLAQDPSSWTELLGPETAWQLETVPQVCKCRTPGLEINTFRD